MMALSKMKSVAALVGAFCVLGGVGAWVSANLTAGAAGTTAIESPTGTFVASQAIAPAAARSAQESLGPVAVATADQPGPASAADSAPAGGSRIVVRAERAAEPAPAAGAAAARDDGAPAEDLAIKAQLARPLPEVNFDAVAFSDVIDFFRDVSGANIFVNWKALEAEGVDKGALVTARLKNVRFDKALETVLASAAGDDSLAFKVDRGVITISTARHLGGGWAPGPAAAGGRRAGAGAGGDAGERAVTAKRVYEVTDLVAGGADREAAVVRMITGSVAPSAWKDNGGSGEAKVEGGKLVVTTTPENQKAVANLLEQVRKLTPATSATPARSPATN